MGSSCSSVIGAGGGGGGGGGGGKAVNGFRWVPWIRQYFSRIFVLWYKRVPPLDVGFVDLLLLTYTSSTVCEEHVSGRNLAVPKLRFYERSVDHILPRCVYVQGCRMSPEVGSPCITRGRSALRCQ